MVSQKENRDEWLACVDDEEEGHHLERPPQRLNQLANEYNSENVYCNLEKKIFQLNSTPLTSSGFKMFEKAYLPKMDLKKTVGESWGIWISELARWPLH